MSTMMCYVHSRQSHKIILISIFDTYPDILISIPFYKARPKLYSIYIYTPGTGCSKADKVNPG